jgi:hypothetical protein
MVPARPDEPASVVAARQLAEEARARRRGPHPGRGRRLSAARSLPEAAGDPDRSARAR